MAGTKFTRYNTATDFWLVFCNMWKHAFCTMSDGVATCVNRKVVLFTKATRKTSYGGPVMETVTADNLGTLADSHLMKQVHSTTGLCSPVALLS